MFLSLLHCPHVSKNMNCSRQIRKKYFFYCSRRAELMCIFKKSYSVVLNSKTRSKKPQLNTKRHSRRKKSTKVKVKVQPKKTEESDERDLSEHNCYSQPAAANAKPDLLQTRRDALRVTTLWATVSRFTFSFFVFFCEHLQLSLRLTIWNAPYNPCSVRRATKTTDCTLAHNDTEEQGHLQQFTHSQQC